MDIMTYHAENVRTLVDFQGRKKSWLALHLEIPRTVVKSKLKGRLPWDAGEKATLCDILGVPPDMLFPDAIPVPVAEPRREVGGAYLLRRQRRAASVEHFTREQFTDLCGPCNGRKATRSWDYRPATPTEVQS